MSIAHAVAHGAFGRACLYELDRPMVPHAHREGHLIFHVSGPVASVVIDGKTLPLTTRSATAISPWQPHYFAPIDRREPTLTLVLYIRPGWFVNASHTAFEILRFGRSTVEMSDHITRLVSETARLLADHGGCDGSFEDRLSALTQAAFRLTDAAPVSAEPVHVGDDWFILRYKDNSRTTATREEFARQRQEQLSQSPLLATRQREALVVYINRLRSSAEHAGQVTLGNSTRIRPPGDGGADGGAADDDNN